ncbi:hypothetical protein ACFQ9X_24770 [Catenulispora yoronensis]
MLDDQTSAAAGLAPQQVVNKVLTPKTPTASGTVFFVELLVRQNGTLVDRNVYWQPTTGDVPNWSSTIGNPQAAMTSYANLTALRNLPQNSAVSVSAATTDAPGPNGADKKVTVTLTNNSTTKTVGFFLRADIRRGTASGQELSGDNELQSSIWGDNDVTLWPGESETLTASYNSADLQGATPVVSVSGWNTPKTDVVAGTATSSNDFSVATASPSGAVSAGAAVTTTVSTALVSGSAEPVALTASGLPSGATASFSPATVTAGNSSILTIATSASTPAGTYPITITGTAPSATHSTTYTLQVSSGTPTNDFSIAVAPTAGSVSAGGTVTGTVATTVVSGSAEPVALSASGLPGGATASFSPATVTAGANSALTIATSASTPAGNYTVTITGTATSATHTTSFALTVTPVTGGGPIVNGGFESGTLTGWTVNSGSASAVSSPVHSGGFAALVGATGETSGTSKLSQTFTAPSGSSTLSFWYDVNCTDTSSGFATVFLVDNTASSTTRVVNRVCDTGKGWRSASAPLTPGHSYTLQLEARDDGVSGTPSNAAYDDITVS